MRHDREVMAAIADMDVFTVAMVAEATGLAPTEVSGTVVRLRHKGAVERAGDTGGHHPKTLWRKR